MSRTVRTLILFGAPITVGVLNLFHPVYLRHTGIYDGLHAFTDWWITLHVLNLFGFALLGLAAYLLILDRNGIAATVAKAALLLFVPSYAGFDSIIGIATGNLMQYASRLPLGQLPALKTAIDAFWNNGVATLLAIVGSVAWSLAMSAAAVSFAGSRRAAAAAIGVIAGAFTGWGYSASMFGTLPWWMGVAAIAAISLLVVRPAWPSTLLILAGILFGTTHVPPYGPLGMAFFVAAVAITHTAPNRVGARQDKCADQPPGDTMTSSPSEADVRNVQAVDMPIVRALILEMLSESPLAFGESLADAQARSEADWSALVQHLIMPDVRTAFMAYDEDGACGFVCADSDLPQAGPDTVVISRLWVAPRQRGSGLGTRLMAAVMEWAQEKGAAMLGLGVTEMNSSAMHFYEHLEYKDTGMRFAWPPDPTKKIIVLGRALRA